MVGASQLQYIIKNDLCVKCSSKGITPVTHKIERNRGRPLGHWRDKEWQKGSKKPQRGKSNHTNETEDTLNTS